ncbi:hypothetical protein AOLI_G00081580 [Acnodon oligacanthus]
MDGTSPTPYLRSGSRPETSQLGSVSDPICHHDNPANTDTLRLQHHISKLKPRQRQEKPEVRLLTHRTTPAVLIPT